MNSTAARSTTIRRLAGSTSYVISNPWTLSSMELNRRRPCSVRSSRFGLEQLTKGLETEWQRS